MQLVTVCEECGWYAGSDEPTCPHALAAQAAAEAVYEAALDRLVRVWACSNCGTVYEGKHASKRCAICDHGGTIRRMTLGEAQRKKGT